MIGYFEGKAVLPRIYFRRQWASRGGEAFSGLRTFEIQKFRLTSASCEHVATRPTSTSVAVRSLRRRKEARRSIGLDGESFKISRGRPMFIANQKLSLVQVVKRAFFADRWCFFSSCTAAQCVIDSDNGDSKVPSHHRPVGNHFLASSGVKRHGPPLAQPNASGKTATARSSNIGLVNLQSAFCPSVSSMRMHGSVRFAPQLINF